jgi:hypothetical protein
MSWFLFPIQIHLRRRLLVENLWAENRQNVFILMTTVVAAGQRKNRDLPVLMGDFPYR